MAQPSRLPASTPRRAVRLRQAAVAKPADLSRRAEILKPAPIGRFARFSRRVNLSIGSELRGAHRSSTSIDRDNWWVRKRNIYDPGVSLIELRKAVGMVFQRPNPLPISVYENVVFGLRIHSGLGRLRESELDAAVEKALRETLLWDDLKDRLDTRATTLQLEQQQKLCIARLLPLKPEVILMDEPCSALDSEATLSIEELMLTLAGRYTIVIVTHNMAQARRVSQECAFMLMGEAIEHARTEDLFLTPKDSRTADYIEGRYG